MIWVLNVSAPWSDPNKSENWNAIRDHAKHNWFFSEHFTTPWIWNKSWIELSIETYKSSLFEKLSEFKTDWIAKLIINTDSAAMEPLVQTLLDDKQNFYNPSDITILVSNPMHLLKDDDGIDYEWLFRMDMKKNWVNVTEAWIQSLVQSFRSLDDRVRIYSSAWFANIYTFVASNDLLVSKQQKQMFTDVPFQSTTFQTERWEWYFHNTISINEMLPDFRLSIYNSLNT